MKIGSYTAIFFPRITNPPNAAGFSLSIYTLDLPASSTFSELL
jgi:hypothetical protein